MSSSINHGTPWFRSSVDVYTNVLTVHGQAQISASNPWLCELSQYCVSRGSKSSLLILRSYIWWSFRHLKFKGSTLTMIYFWIGSQCRFLINDVICSYFLFHTMTQAAEVWQMLKSTNFSSLLIMSLRRPNVYLIILYACTTWREHRCRIQQTCFQVKMNMAYGL